MREVMQFDRSHRIIRTNEALTVMTRRDIARLPETD
jgi:hypothetical protein